MPESSKYWQRNLVLDNGHLLVQVLKRSGILEKRIVSKELGFKLRMKCCWNSQKADILFSVQRHHCPGVHSRAKDMETVNTFHCRLPNNWNSFSHNYFRQSAQYLRSSDGYMWRIWNPSRSIRWTWCIDGTINCSRWNQGRDFFAEWRLFHIIKFWQQYIERIESLSPESKVSRICMEAGFMRVEVGRYFITKDTGDFRQFRSVACREYTLLRDDPTSQPKGWIQGYMRIGLVLEVTTSFQYAKHGIEIRIWPVGQDNSQSWVRISDGTNKYVIDSNHNHTVQREEDGA